MQTFHHLVDFDRYNMGDSFNEYLTPGNSCPGKIVQTDSGKGLFFNGPTWLSYIRPWKDLDNDDVVTVKQKFTLAYSNAVNIINLLTYNTKGWGHAALSIYQGSLRLQAFANYEDAFKWVNPLQTVTLGAWNKEEVHEWEVRLTKTHVSVDIDGQAAINVDIPTALQGRQIDSLRVRSWGCIITAHEASRYE